MSSSVPTRNSSAAPRHSSSRGSSHLWRTDSGSSRDSDMSPSSRPAPPRTNSSTAMPQRYSPRSQRLNSQASDDDDDDACNDMRKEIEEVKDQSVGSTRNMLMRLREAESAGTGSLDKLQEQNERLGAVEKKMLQADYHANQAHNKTNDLLRLNKNFLVAKLTFANPFTKTKRRERKLEGEIAEQRRLEDEKLEIDSELRHKARKAPTAVKESRPQLGGMMTRTDCLDDEIDCEKEAEIDSNLDEIASSVSRLKAMGLAMGESIKTTSSQIVRIEERAVKTTDQVRRTERKLRDIN